MRRLLPLALLNIFCLLASLPARADFSSQDYRFKTADGTSWVRHVLVETGESKRLLLVVDQPQDGRLQKVSFRKSFDLNDATFRSALAQWKNPAQHLNADFFAQAALTPSAKPLWPVTHAWDAAAENDYNNWVATEVTTDMLRGGRVKVDCADFAMTIRWLYAREHGLPAGNSLAGGGHLQGSWESTLEWDQLPTAGDWKRDERFKAALRYVLENSYTHTVVDDLYPVSITPDYVKSGTVYLTFHGQSGHTRTYLAIGKDNRCSGSDPCFVQIYGNEPKADEGYIQTYETPTAQPEGKGGLMRFRWPVADAQGNWRLLDPKKMPGYSHEQYEWDETDFNNNLSIRLSLYGSREQMVVAEGNTLVGLIRQRLDQTEQGYYLCSLVLCAPGSEQDEAWSTWNRDSRLVTAINRFRTDLPTVNPRDYRVSQMIRLAKRSLLNGSPQTYWDLISVADLSLWKSDPTVSLESRWGWSGLAEADQINIEVEALKANFYKRYDKVYEAHFNCAGGRTDCSKGSPTWKELETSRYDAGFRIALQNFTRLYQNLPGQERTDTDAKLMATPFAIEICGASGSEECSAYELLVAHPEHIQNMTSEPTDTERQRWGF